MMTLRLNTAGNLKTLERYISEERKGILPHIA
jgi:hypothetical protein